jgi:superfamily I DNA/RNA helicase
MELSKYQAGILEWVKTGDGNGCCNAVAGSGKSTTLRLAATTLQESGIKPSEVKVIVFGKANANDLIEKFGRDWKGSISTLHSAGFSLLKQTLNSRKAVVSDKKYKKIAEELQYIDAYGFHKGFLKREDALAKDADFLKIIDLVRLTNRPPIAETIEEICNHFEIPEVWEFKLVASAVADCLEAGEKEAEKNKSFDFTDQIWLPVKWRLGDRREFKPYRFVLVDECQDLNAAQLELCLILAGQSGRLLFVGDPRQAIMGFAGADCDSYRKIVDRVRAKELPLSICYRCPRSHIELVKKLYPAIPIEPRPGAIEGRIERIEENELDKYLKTGDMVLSRKTAPLVSLCIKLIARGIPATVKGKSIGEQIKADLEAIGKMPGFSYDRFNEAVNAYRNAKAIRYRGNDNEEKLLETLNDKLTAILTIYRSNPQATSIAALETYIEDLFSDDHSPITLSTCHRAKGLEGDRVFILNPDDMPMRWRNQSEWQAEQEDNLLYVALTRSKSELFIIGDADWYPDPDEEKAETATVNDDSKADTDEKPAGAYDEKRARVRATLEDPEWTVKSDRAIAEHCKVSAPMVAKMRRQLNLAEETERVGRKGNKIKTARIGNKPKKSPREKIGEIIAGLTREEILELADWLKEEGNLLDK